MASEDSSFDLQSLLADAQDLVDESFVARALLQPETNPWERFPLDMLYPTEDPFNEIHLSALCDLPADSLLASEPPIKTEPTEDTALLSTVSQPQCDFELAEYLVFTHEDHAIASPTTTILLSSSPIHNSDAPLPQTEPENAEHSCLNAQLEYPDASTSPTTTISSSSSPTEETPLLELTQYLYFTDHLDDTITTPVTADSNSFPITDTNPTTTISLSPPSFSSFSAPTASPTTTIVSPRPSLFSSSFPSIISSEPTSSCSSNLSPSNAPTINAEDVPCSTVTLDVPCSTVNSDAGEPEPQVCYTFVDPHAKPRKRRAKGVKNSTPIACTFCRRRKIRCGGPQEGGVCKSCIRLNYKGECVFPAVSYRGQRLGGSASKCKLKGTAKRTSHSSKSP